MCKLAIFGRGGLGAQFIARLIYLNGKQMAKVFNWNALALLKTFLNNGDVIAVFAQGVGDSSSIFSPALVKLVAEELSLNVTFIPQTVPHIPYIAPAPESLSNRMFAITVMGHVDHDKTSLLDALRNSNVSKHEHSGITQSVAAFRVPISFKNSTGSTETNSFATNIDTPGHASFSTMRYKGAIATDSVVFFVASNDGVMPQTIEAANLARAENFPIII